MTGLGTPGRSPLAFLLAAALALLPFVAACTTADSPAQVTSTPPAGMASADSAVASLIAGIGAADLSEVTFADGATPQKLLEDVVAGMRPLAPAVTSGAVVYAGDGTAVVPLTITWPVGKGWTYASSARLRLDDQRWRVVWDPSIVYPGLKPGARLTLKRTTPPRAPINGSDGLALVEEVPSVRIGLDKANLATAAWESSAKQLAGILRIDPRAYAAKVAASGEKAFVVATTVRQGELPEAVSYVPGIYLQDTVVAMAPSPTFASGLLGATGEATSEIIEQSRGAVRTGDIVGLTGLQRRHDDQLRGTPGYVVQLVAPKPMATPAPGEPRPTPEAPVTVFASEAVPGRPLNLTLNADVQTKAESVLAAQKDVAAIVVLKASTGEILAAANSPASGANPFATTGRYPPGSTFKIATSLALLRRGSTPSTLVTCTPAFTVSGRAFPNYDDYPGSGLGRVPLSRAFAQSCNTAFMQAGQALLPTELGAAAASLGVGIDYNPGFASFYGSVPPQANAIAHAAGMIGQGQVEASPMAMAAVAASAASGKTQIPWMVKGTKPASKAKPLTAAEAATLRSLMAGVVSGGTAQALKGIVDGAKTGTAQFGATAPYKKHAWMVAWKGDVAVAAFVYDGDSGSKTAGPLVKAFFS